MHPEGEDGTDGTGLREVRGDGGDTDVGVAIVDDGDDTVIEEIEECRGRRAQLSRLVHDSWFLI